MSAEKYAVYIDRIERAQSDIAVGDFLVAASRDYDLTTAEFIRLDNWAKRLLSERRRKGRKG